MDNEFNKRVFETIPDTLWTGKVPAVKKKTPVFRYIYHVAAAACIVFCVFTLLKRPASKDAPAAAQAIAPPEEVVYTVNDAVRASMYLPDSTSVTLNCGSTLKLSPEFGKSNRTVYLDGEALFDVRKNRALPFIVNTPKGIEVKVTGTRFNLSSYADDRQFGLTLFQGSVVVTTRKKEVLEVAPSETLIIRDEFLNISKTDAPQQAVQWTEGVLRFDRTPMKDAISKIEKWYGVGIKVEQEDVYRNTLSGTFKSEPLEDVLRLICISSHLSYSMNDKTVTLRSNR